MYITPIFSVDLVALLKIYTLVIITDIAKINKCEVLTKTCDTLVLSLRWVGLQIIITAISIIICVFTKSAISRIVSGILT